MKVLIVLDLGALARGAGWLRQAAVRPRCEALPLISNLNYIVYGRIRLISNLVTSGSWDDCCGRLMHVMRSQLDRERVHQRTNHHSAAGTPNLLLDQI
jgi:hypothetical protein